MTTTGSDDTGPEAFWDGFYRERPQVWSGRVNAVLAEVASGLTPGTALDLGSGEGGDAIWLAGQGWAVTAVDVSEVALRRAAMHAADTGVDAITWERHDLAESFPAGTFDLVSAQYLHSPIALAREQVLRQAAGAVAPGGALLIVGHAAFPPWATDHDPTVHFPTPEEVVADLELSDQWSVVRHETVDREAEGPGGRRGTLRDSIVLVRRAPAEGSG